MLKFFNNLPDRLTRITTGGKVVREIDGLRFAAILPVVCQHLAERMHKYSTANFQHNTVDDFISYSLSRGFVGVNVFYLISGFILCLPFASHYLFGAKKVPLKSYFHRRLTRLEPPYILLMSFFFLVLVFVQSQDFREVLPHYLTSLLYIHNAVYLQPSTINPVAWTLEIEVQFYIVAPFLAFLFFSIKDNIWRGIVLILSVVIIITTQQLTGFSVVPAALFIVGQIHYFLAGFFLANIYLVYWNGKVPEKKSYLYDVVGLVGLLGMVYGKSPELLNRLYFIFSLFIFCYGAFKGKIINRFFSNRWVSAIGGMCYTIYLIHLPFLELFIRLTRNWQFTNSFTINYLIQAAICLPILLTVSIIFFLLIEKPCMDKEWPVKLATKIKKLWN